MTSHELARKLLELPDRTIGFHEYNGGDTPFKEIETAEFQDSDSVLSTYPTGGCILLST